MTYLNALLFSWLAGLSTIFGIFLVMLNEKFTKKYSILFVSLAAGVLLGAGFFELIPESFALNSHAMLITLIGFLLFYLLENLIVVHICKERDCTKHRIGIMAVLGVTFHSFIDGVVIGISFGISYVLGIISATAVIAHEFPEGILAYSMLIHSDFNKKKSLLYSIFIALATPIGTIIALLFIKSISVNILGGALAFAAGSFLYIASSDLIPETHEKFSRLNALLVILGVLFIFGIERLL